MQLNNGVSFFKILLRDDVDYLPLPPSFAKKYLKNKNQTLILKTKSTVKWSIRYLKIEDRYYFMDGWLKFINDNRLRMGDFLVFWLQSSSIFQVYIYAPNGCLKNPTTSSGNLHRPIHSRVPLFRPLSAINSLSHVAVAGGGKNHKILKKHIVKVEETSDDDTKEGVQQSFRRVVSKTCIHKLAMNKSFVKGLGINGYRSVRLKNEEGKMWEVKVSMYGGEKVPYLTKGWFDFRKDNKIEIGDKCEFNRVKNNLLHVHVLKKKGKPFLKDP
ncbi:putative B3 domain-containing protein Os03g0621600 [Cynara cardunculus var. scolymus]|uniref:putative B3 domain-containing protein Os03g0621600 n=1 Tax=Cynara cardunculus var. scolymus TaxID=59895 RepID=UPI000D629925|nr:putative B3 domain-containing protein Os03g0621600 [Cynara cardunculus var. scolymus]